MQFSLARLIYAVSVFAVAFAIFSYLGVIGIVISVWIGMCLGLTCLLVRPERIWPTIRTGIVSLTGGGVGVFYASLNQSSYKPDDEIAAFVTGTIIGFAIGITITHFQFAKTNNT